MREVCNIDCKLSKKRTDKDLALRQTLCQCVWLQKAFFNLQLIIEKSSFYSHVSASRNIAWLLRSSRFCESTRWMGNKTARLNLELFISGTDGGGSIRIPSSYCGVVGLKATYARFNLAQMRELSNTVGHAGKHVEL